MKLPESLTRIVTLPYNAISSLWNNGATTTAQIRRETEKYFADTDTSGDESKGNPPSPRAAQSTEAPQADKPWYSIFLECLGGWVEKKTNHYFLGRPVEYGEGATPRVADSN